MYVFKGVEAVQGLPDSDSDEGGCPAGHGLMQDDTGVSGSVCVFSR